MTIEVCDICKVVADPDYLVKGCDKCGAKLCRNCELITTKGVRLCITCWSGDSAVGSMSKTGREQ